jgi:hypothetical protein
MQSTSQMLLFRCQQRLHLPGLLKLRNAWAAADSGSGMASIAQEFRDGHYVMAPQAAPAVGLREAAPSMSARILRNEALVCQLRAELRESR